MRDKRRRNLLRSLGVTGVVGLAGCQDVLSDGSSSDEDGDPTRDDTDTDRTDATQTGGSSESGDDTSTDVSFQLETSAEAASDATRLFVTGTVSSDAGLDSVTVRTDEDSTQVTFDGETEHEVDAQLLVDGGRSYEVEVAVVDANGTESTERVETDHVPIAVDPIETDRLVGAHYYPWYEMAGGHTEWTGRCVSNPELGEYAADDRTVVDRHLKWCLEHGVRWLSVSWWGPQSPSDHVLGTTLTSMERFQDVEFSILYETVGRFEAYDYDLDDERARERLRDDLTYLAGEFFQDDNYLHRDGRPVLYFYVSNNFRGDVEGAFEAATADLEADPYVLAGVPFGSPPSTYPISNVADGVTSYNPYSSRSDIESVFHDQYETGNATMHLGSRVADAEFVPVVIPGFNDSELPTRDNPVLPASPERYERVCEQVTPHLADSGAVLVTSFNEWYENTQIEPGEEYGNAYLELTADRLATGDSPGFDPDGTTVRLAFTDTVVPAERSADSDDTRPLAFVASELSFHDENDVVATFDVGDPPNEPLFLKGAFSPNSLDDRSIRWFGGGDAETVMFVEADVSAADAAVLRGEPVASNEVAAAVYVDGDQTDYVEFGGRDGSPDDYELSLE